MRTTEPDRREPTLAPAAGEAPLFYSVPQIARMLGTAPVTLYRAIRAGEFPAIRVRGRLIVPARAVEAMAEAAVAQRTVVDAAGWVPEGVTPR